MSELRYTLLADGPADRALIPILDWLLRQHLPARPIQHQWADLNTLSRRRGGLARRMEASVRLYPCDILFVHRDAEAQPRQSRIEEIARARHEGDLDAALLLCCVVPVRMTEAWLLFDEAAIRKAAGNPRGRTALARPAAPESIARPEDVLAGLLRDASELSGRRREKFNVPQSVQRLAQLIEDFSPLRALDAFQTLEADLRELLRGLGGQ